MKTFVSIEMFVDVKIFVDRKTFGINEEEN
jgi:hypothetical protein